MDTVNLHALQQPLRAHYKTNPKTAMVVDRAITTSNDDNDPFHFSVKPMPSTEVKIPVGVHHALGGPHDAPTPGDLLCAALAACQDSSIRMVANLLGVEIEYLEVEVTGNVDVRGTLAMDKTVPTGFQSMRCEVTMKVKPGTPETLIKRLQLSATQSCVVRQTLQHTPAINTRFQVNNH